MFRSFKLIMLSAISAVFMITIAHADIVVVNGEKLRCEKKKGVPGSEGCNYSKCFPKTYDAGFEGSKVSCGDCGGPQPQNCSSTVAGTRVKCKPLNSGAQQRFLCEKPKKATSVKTDAGTTKTAGSPKTKPRRKPRKKPRGKKAGNLKGK